MLPSTLSLNKNAYGTSAFDISMPAYDTWEVLGKCVTYALINLAYDSDEILFLTKIKKELSSCISQLRNYTGSDNNKYLQEFNNTYILERQAEILSVCECLISDRKFFPDSTDEIINVLFRDAEKWQKCIVMYLFENSQEESNAFEVENVYVPYIVQNGFTFDIELSFTKTTFKYNPSSHCNIMDFVCSFDIAMGDTDKYLSVLGGVHPIPNILNPTGFSSRMTTVRSLFTTSRVKFIKQDFKLIVPILSVIAKLRSKKILPTGPLTKKVLDMLEANDINVAAYLNMVYSGKSESVTDSALEAYRESDAYEISHDVMLSSYVSLEAGETDESDEIEELKSDAEDPESDDDDDNTDPENDPEEGNEDPEASAPEPDDPEKDEGEEGEEKSEPEKSPSAVDNGIIIEISSEVNLDSYIYREEIRLEITRILNDDKIELSQVARTALNRLVTYWLHFLTPSSIDSMIRTVANIDIKYK